MLARLNFPGGLSAVVLFVSVLVSGCTPGNSADLAEHDPLLDQLLDPLRFEGENHLSNIRQLTFGGNNAEAYWSPDGKQLVFQSDFENINAQGCDQIFVMNADGSAIGESQYQLASTGEGRTTCGYFLADGRVLYASTHEAARECPAPVFSAAGRYVWPIYPSYDIYAANPDGSGVELLIGGEGYDAEATVSPDGKYVVFTSTRSGDLELWRYEFATGEELQLTNTLGYDGGAFFSPDSKQIVWRASRPQGEDAEVYRTLLADDKVEPGELDIFVADIDGSNARKVTDLPGANWAPFFHPDGKRVLFTTNHHMMETNPRVFDIFMVNLDGTGLEQITHSEVFDGFPMFSPDGKRIAFSSNRNAPEEGSTNVFVADWVE